MPSGNSTDTLLVHVLWTTALPGNNSTLLNGTASSALQGSTAFDDFLKTVCLLVLAVGAVGNFVVVVTFGIRWTRLKTCEVFMINLAVADLVGTACLPLITFFELQKISMAPLRDVGCQWLYAFNLSSLTVSALTLVCIAADRFVVVSFPFRRKPHKLTVVLVCLVTWLLSFALAAVYLFNGVRIRRSKAYPTHYSCRSNMSTAANRIHNVVIFLMQVLLPMVVMAVLYSLILKSLRLNRCQALTQNNRMMEIRLKQNRRTTKLFLTVVFTFYCLILPHNIFMMTYTFVTVDPTVAFYLYYTTLMLHMVNSSVNPIIYARMHHSFRDAAFNFLCCRTGSLSSTAWRSLVKSRKRMSTMTTSRLTTTSKGCPSPVTDSYSLQGTLRSTKRHSTLLQDTNANLALIQDHTPPRARPVLPRVVLRTRDSCPGPDPLTGDGLGRYSQVPDVSLVPRNAAAEVVLEDRLTSL